MKSTFIFLNERKYTFCTEVLAVTIGRAFPFAFWQRVLQRDFPQFPESLPILFSTLSWFALKELQNKSILWIIHRFFFFFLPGRIFNFFCHLATRLGQSFPHEKDISSFKTTSSFLIHVCFGGIISKTTEYTDRRLDGRFQRTDFALCG